MAGRFAYWMMAGGAILAGMALQGDLSFNTDRHRPAIDARHGDEEADRAHQSARAADPQAGRSEAAVRRDMSDAIAELARAETRLIALRLDEDRPPADIEQAEQRRDAARDAVERIAQDAEARSDNRDAVRQDIREAVRDAVRT